MKPAAGGAGLAALFAAGAAQGAAFSVYVQGISGLGNSYAGAAAVAEDATTVWWNPAGMAWLPAGKHFAGSVALVEPSTKFSNTGSAAAAGRPLGGDGGDAGRSAFVPAGFFAMDLGPRVRVGLGAGMPFGLKTEYDPSWAGRFHGIRSELRTRNLNPSASYRIGDALSAGVGLSYMQGELELLSAVNLGAAEAQNRTKLEGDGWGFNAGVLGRAGPATRLGLHYRSPVKFKLDGDTAFTSPVPASQSGKVKMAVETPATLAFSLVHRLNERTEILADGTWWRWSTIERLPVVRTDGPSSGATLDTLVLDFRDTWRLSAGANHRLPGAWTLKLGAAFDQTPVRRAHTRTVRVPDADRYWVSAGVKYPIAKTGALDVGYAYIKAKDAPIDNDQSAANRGIVRGTYKASLHILGVQYRRSF